MNKKESMQKCKQILSCQKELSGDEYNFALNLFLKRRSIPNGVKYLKIKVDKHPVFSHNNSCFYFDGHKWQDFSLYKSLNHPESVKKEDIIKAFRFEIHDQIRIFKKKAFELEENAHLLLAYNKDRLSVHVDHVYPFFLLLSDFLLQEIVNIENLKVIEQKQSVFLLADRELAFKWQLYHKNKAVLQLLLSQDNLQKGNRIYD